MTPITSQYLSQFEDRHISKICTEVQLSNQVSNHCAHFVNHLLEFKDGLSCGKLLGKRGNAANLRVHETFKPCPVVGEFDERPLGPCLAFVTQRSAVNLAQHSMINVPKKHVGIYCDGQVWHYSNLAGKVVRQTPEEFSRHYEQCSNGWCKIPAGCFIFGTPEGTPGRAAIGEEQGPVTLPTTWK